MNVKETLIEVQKLLQVLEDKYLDLPKKQSEVDSKLSDIYHYIENNNLNTNQRYRAVGAIARLRKERREILNEYELLKTYKLHEQKLCEESNRKMLIAELGKREKSLDLEYKNRVYTEEELQKIIGN